MKKLLLTLLVLSTIVSCGKKNTVGDAGVSGLSASVTGQNEVSLASSINNNAFGLSYTQMLLNNPNFTYYYNITTQSSNNCSVKWSIFYVCSNTSTNSNSTFSRQVVHGSVDIAAKKAELISIINKRNSIYVSGSVNYVYTNDSKLYIIDTAYPLQANPMQIQDNITKKTEYFVRGM